MNLFELFVKVGVDDQASDKLSNITDKLGNGLKKAAKIGVAAMAGIGAAAIKAYADYEQLVGGVDTLFKSSSPKVQQYASEAFRTAGLSANEYMSTVTSFSASLLQSLGGDTAKAAKYAHIAVTDMSDNANKMGTDMSLIQNAYQGFAKQNYTMLDNLKLGYGGTKEEMERLISDAAKLDSSIDANDMSFGNIVKSINAVQKEMGIYGTTALEAEKTISGSFQSMKGAWTNFLVAMVDGNQDAGEAFDKLWESAKTFLGNLGPKIWEVIGSFDAFGVVLLSTAAAFAAYKTINTVVKGIQALKTATESTSIAQALLNKVMNANPFVLIGTLIAGVVAALITLWNTSDGFREAITAIWDAIKNVFSSAWEVIKNIFSSVGNFFVGVWNSIAYAFSSVVSFFSDIFSRAWEGITSAFSAVGKFFSGVWSGIKNAFGSVVNFFGNIFSGAWKAIKNAFSGVGKFFGGIWDKIVGTFKTVGTKVANAIGGAFKSAINAVIATIEGALNLIPKAINGAIGLINKLPGVEISKIPLINLPRLERGGVLKRGQIGLLEGNGAEAVVPLERHTGWINRIAEQLDEKMQYKQSNAQGYSRQSVEFKVGIDDKANAMGLARALLPLLKVAEKEMYV